jgi:hypothetical protein
VRSKKMRLLAKNKPQNVIISLKKQGEQTVD